MIRKTFIIIVSSILLMTAARAQEHRAAMGAAFMEPTGLSVKLWLGGRHALAGAVGGILGREESWRAHLDYLFLKGRVFDSPKSTVDFYSGLGGRMEFQENERFRLRIPLGLDFTSRKIPLNLFAEAVPMIEFSSGINVFLRASLGIRFLFSR